MADVADGFGRFPDPETLAICEQFSLWLRQGGGLPIRGRPLPMGDASGLDFEGFAEYSPGMDLRHLDWTIYARTRAFYVRTYADEGAGVLAVLLDGSGSMGVGSPSKWGLARRLAAALTFAGLREVDSVLVGVARGSALEALPVTGGLSFASTAFAFLGCQSPAGTTDLGAALGALPTGLARGDAIVISDFLDPCGAEAGLEAMSRAGWRVDLIRIAARAEFDLPPPGTALHDPEGEGHQLVPRDPSERDRLGARIREQRTALVTSANRWGAVLVEVMSDDSLPVGLMRFFRAVSARAHGGAARAAEP